ncbi:peptidyl-prolyl cis-trans isomerase D [Vibrio orientalis CIP 102891 = ATCC 33934]|uniref:Periplasmic chaperone PpiD n=1 Tax=Vibrio orientalis CIP 102891 = ATCC 33934 TaxID=675816 RepID=C9QLR1_VIBOR|nr:peptidylprolyl isomerase [Vibrio orientalis]EEX92835.1 peptidyl-prolyl cis-trans isomerase PpiD [Vibrio orientalis CIP 102891 = ATCC 33934]EGU46515.1 peptidyl-prolyl cis-trans isomerase D [Vibrio orientalis CIP 102891 = ATCC 33934]
MMDRLREGVNSIAVKIILGLIILSFVFAGVGSYIVGGSNNTAAKVGNVEIGRGEFEQAYQNERNRMQAQLGDYFSNLLADPSYVESFRKSVLDRMVNDVLLEQHAESLGLRVSDTQVRTLILEMPQFQIDGKFDQEIYQTALRRAGFNAESFAEYLRRDLVRNQLLTAIQGSDFTLPSEVEAQSKLLTQTREVKKVTLSLEDFAAKAQLSEDEINDYYKQNPERYTRPEQVKVAYIELSAQQLKDDIQVSEEQAKQYYQEHLDKYSSEEQRRVSHILVEGDDQAKAQAILDELNAGADFATLAEEKSDDFGSASEGGSLGWIERDVMDPAFEDAAFALTKVGDTTGLVKSDFGYHIIKLDELKDSVAKPYAEVAAEIKQELKDQQAVDQYYELQSELEKVAFEYPDSLDDAAQAINAKIHTTDFISQVDAPELLKTPAVLQAIVSPEVKEDGLNSEVIEVAPEHVIVVRVEDARDEMVLPLADVREQVTTTLAKVKGEQSAIELADKLVAELKEGKQGLLKESGLVFGETETVDRSSPLADVVFSMVKPEEGKVEFAQAKDLNGDIVVVELTDVSSMFNTMYNEQIAQQMTQANAQQDLSGLISILRKTIDIEYYVVTQ